MFLSDLNEDIAENVLRRTIGQIFMLPPYSPRVAAIAIVIIINNNIRIDLLTKYFRKTKIKPYT